MRGPPAISERVRGTRPAQVLPGRARPQATPIRRDAGGCPSPKDTGARSGAGAERELLLDPPAHLEGQGRKKAGTTMETLLIDRPNRSHQEHKHLSRVQWADWSVPPLRRPPPRAHLLNLRF